MREGGWLNWMYLVVVYINEEKKIPPNAYFYLQDCLKGHFNIIQIIKKRKECKCCEHE
jgi:hypothetical protein